MIPNGTLLGNRYEILDLVGTGGMADVYKAKCHRLNRFVAVKVLKEEFAKDADFLKRFQIEAQAAAGLAHPNIVNVYDVGEDEGLHYIVMELLDGITLKDYIEQKNILSAREAVSVALQIAEGIEAAHKNKTVHRDIKPQNMIIDKQGRVKVTDFGIARAASTGTITVTALGSVHYFSPEQARNGYVDARSDIYSLGITLYEMVTGHVPFDGDSAVAVALKHIQEEITFTDEERAKIPKSLENIILKATNKKKEYRYATATQMIADLKKVFEDPSGLYVKTGAAMMSGGSTIVMSTKEVEEVKRVTGKGKEIIKELDENDQEEESLFRNTEEMNPKLEKIIIRVTIGVLIAFAVIFIAFFAKSFKNFFDANLEPVTTAQESTSGDMTDMTTEENVSKAFVPDVVNKEKEEAVKMMEDEGFQVVIKTEASNDVEENHVIRQSIPYGKEMEKGTTVTLYVCEGKEQITIENVTGKEETEAKKVLMEQGFEVKTEESYSSLHGEGIVISQTPGHGEKAAYGSVITLQISKGAKEVSVPFLIGSSKEEAEKALKEADLSIGKVEYEYSSSYDEGIVIEQSVEKGTKVNAKSTVDIVISKGPENVKVSYQGDITINCPFDEEKESAAVRLDLSQKGNVKKVFEKTLTRDDFPLYVSFEGYAQGNGVITVYVDDVKYKSYDVTIEKVTE